MAIGTVSSGYFTVAIAVHSFFSLVLQKRQSAIICRSIIAGGWFLSILMGAIPFGIRFPEGAAYGPDGVICGIRSIFPKLQFFFHLLPILLSSFLGAILYSLTFLVLRGTVKFREGIKLTLNPAERWANRNKDDENYRRFVAKLSRSMLWYPVAYAVLLVPYSMVRLFALSGFPVSFEATAFAFVCWHLHGVVNVPLLYNTSRLLGKAFGDAVSSPNTEKDLESFVSDNHKEKYSTDRRLAGSPSQGPTPSTVWSTDLISEKTMSEAESSRTRSPIVTHPTSPVEQNQVPQILANASPIAVLESVREESFANQTFMPMMRRPSQSTPRDVSFIEDFPPLPDVQSNLTFMDSPPPVRPLNLSRRPTGIPLPSNPRPPRLPPPSFIASRSRSSPGTSPLIRERSLLTTRRDLAATSELTYLQDASD